MVSAKVWWGIVVVGVLDVIFFIVYVLLEVFEMCSVLLYYSFAAVGAEVVYVEFVSCFEEGLGGCVCEFYVFSVCLEDVMDVEVSVEAFCSDKARLLSSGMSCHSSNM